jgi:hypothetical protein
VKQDDYLYSEPDEGGGRRSVTQIDGVRVTVCENRFEVLAQPGSELREQQTVQMFREWMRKRQEKLRATGDLSV